MQDVNKKIIGFSYALAALCAVVICFAVFATWQQYHERKAVYVDQAKQQLQLYSQSMANDLELSIHAVDQILKRVIEKQRTNLLFGRNLRDDVRHSIALWVNESVLIDAMVVTGADGAVEIIYAEDRPEYDVSPGSIFTAGELLKYHDPDEEIMFFAYALKSSKEDGRVDLLIGRRLEDIDGSFLGVIAVVMNADYMEGLFDQIIKDNHLQMAVVLDNKEIILGQTIEGMKLDSYQNILANTASDPEKEQKEASVTQTNIGNVAHLVSVQNLKSLPITLVLVGKEKELLTRWYSELWGHYQWIIFCFVMSGSFLALMMYLLAHFRQQENIANQAMSLVRGKSHYFVHTGDKIVTPIHAITGFAQMLSEGYFGQVTKEQKQRLNDIGQCAHQVLEAVEQTNELIVADIEAIILDEEPVDITSVIQGVVQLFVAKLYEQKINLVDETLKYHVVIKADSKRIRKMILHVLSNAVQYTPTGGKITIATYYDNQHNFVIDVTDSGDGIHKNELRKILTPFELELNSEETDFKKNKKVSIGLPLCQLYARLHGGRLDVKSKVGAGTKVLITIPKQRVLEQRVQVYEEEITVATV